MPAVLAIPTCHVNHLLVPPVLFALVRFDSPPELALPSFKNQGTSVRGENSLQTRSGAVQNCFSRISACSQVGTPQKPRADELRQGCPSVLIRLPKHALHAVLVHRHHWDSAGCELELRAWQNNASAYPSVLLHNSPSSIQEVFTPLVHSAIMCNYTPPYRMVRRVHTANSVRRVHTAHLTPGSEMGGKLNLTCMLCSNMVSRAS